MCWWSAPAPRALCRGDCGDARRQRHGGGESVSARRNQRPVRRLAVDPRNPLARAEAIDEAADAPLTYLQHEMGAKPPIFVCKPSCVTGRRWWNFSISGRRCSFSGSAMPDFHPSPGAANGGRSVTAQPTMAACSETGSIACVRRWKPLAGGMGIAGGADMAHFSMPPARRAPRCMLPAACCATAGSGYAPDGGSIWSMAMRWSPVCCDPPSTPACVFSSMPRWSGCCRVRRACPARCCAATAGDSRRSWRRGAGLRRFPRSPAAGAGGAPRGGGLRPFLRRTAGQSGRGIRLGESVGGQFDTSLRHPLARAPVSRVTLASGQQLMFPHLVERAKPGVIAVLPNGKRFVNEADSYHDFIAALLAATPGRHAAGTAAGRSSYAASLRHGPRQTVPVHPTAAAYRLSAARKHRRSWRSSALSTPMRWRKPLNALTTSPALAKTSIFTAEHQPITAPG